MGLKLKLTPLTETQNVTGVSLDDSIVLSGGYDYIWDGNYVLNNRFGSGVSSINYSDPANLSVANTFDDGTINCGGIDLWDNILFAPSYNAGGIYALYVNPADGTISEWANNSGLVDTWEFVAHANNHLLIINGDTVTSFSSDPSGNLTEEFTSPAFPDSGIFQWTQGIAGAGNYAYVTRKFTGKTGISVIKIENDGSINFVQDVYSYLTTDTLSDIAITSSKVFQAVAPGGIYSWNINSGDGTLTLDTSIQSGSFNRFVAVDPNEEYVAVGYDGGVRVYDIDLQLLFTLGGLGSDELGSGGTFFSDFGFMGKTIGNNTASFNLDTSTVISGGGSTLAMAPNLGSLSSLSLAGEEIPYQISFQITTDASTVVIDFNQNETAYTGTYTPADLTWGSSDNPATSAYMFGNKVYVGWGASSFASPYGVMIYDLTDHSTEFLSPGQKTINGDYWQSIINCNDFKISGDGFLGSIGSIGTFRGFHVYDINTNTGRRVTDTTTYNGYPLVDSYGVAADRTDTRVCLHNESNNTSYVVTDFNAYPAQQSLLTFNWDTSTMKRLDYQGFRDSSADTPAQINGIPFFNESINTPKYDIDISPIDGGKLFIAYNTDPSLFMYDISTNTGYIFGNTGIDDGTTIDTYASGSITPSFADSPDLIRVIGNYMFYANNTTVYKYDIANNKFIERFSPTEFEDANGTYSLAGDTGGGISDFWYDETNHFYFRFYNNTVGSSTTSEIYFYDLDERVITKVNNNFIGSNVLDPSVGIFSRPSGSGNMRKLVFFGGYGGADDRRDLKNLYEIDY